MNNVKFIKRLDFAYFFGIFFIISLLIEKFTSLKLCLEILFYFLLVSVSYFLLSIFIIKNKKVKKIKVDNNLDDISYILYKNAIYLNNKIGDYYVFKTKNFIVPNVSIFVKEHKKFFMILAPSNDTVWIKQELEEIVSTKQKA